MSKDHLKEIQSYLYHEARRRPWRPLEHLMRFVTDWSVLAAAWLLVRGSHGANTPGVDQLAARDLPASPADKRAFLQELAVQLQSGTYQPGAVRRFEIEKPNQPGKTRTLAILNLRDRVVHMAVKLVLEPMIEARLGKRCFGFRPGRGRYDQLQAVRHLVVGRPGQYGAAVSADIASCFDELDHRLILDDLLALVADPRLIRLFQLLLAQVGSGRTGWWRRRPVGVLQGSPLSPIIANWNLSRFDRAWQQFHGERAPLFRYADDLLLLAPDEAAAARLRRPMEYCLRRANRLALAADKTRVGALDAGIPLLGLLLRRHVDPYTSRQEVRIFVDPGRFRDVFAEVDQWVEQLDADRPLGAQIKRFNQRLRGWFESYQYAHDAAQAFESLDAHLFVAMRRRLKAMIGCSVAALQERYHHRLPSGHDSWQADGEHLLALGALPRKRYRPKRSRAPWEIETRDEPAPIPTERRAATVVSGTTEPPAEPQADRAVAALLHQAAEEALSEVGSILNSRASATLEPVAAGNGRLLPVSEPPSDREGPADAST